jgi:dethiobiotin synthetase
MEGISIQKEPIYDLVVHWRAKSDILFVEGAGGLLVPLSKELLYVDLMVCLNFPVLIVAPNELGAINSTLLTIEAARSRGLEIAGVILNRTEPTGLDNAAAIAQHGKVPLAGSLPTVSPLVTDDILADLAETHLNLDCLLTK